MRLVSGGLRMHLLNKNKFYLNLTYGETCFFPKTLMVISSLIFQSHLSYKENKLVS